MAKRGRKPKGCTVDDLEAGLRSQIDEAVRSHADESAASIYRRFGLAQRGVLLDTFQRRVCAIRRAAAGERLDAASAAKADTARMAEGEMIAELRRRVLVESLASLDAGASKPYEIVGMLSRIQEFDRIEIERAANKRAEEKQSAWRTELQGKIDRQKVEADAKLDRMAVDKGIPDEVRERIKDLYGVNVR